MLTYIRQFTQLTHLRIFPYHVHPTHEIYSVFNDSDFIPRARKLIWKSLAGADGSDIVYDLDLHINEVRFVGQSEEEKRLLRARHLSKESKDPEVTPPQSRLVGIELNPGPSNSVPAFFLVSSLFNDGLLLIFSFLDDRDCIVAASTSHHWFDVAANSKLKFTLEFGDFYQKKKSKSLTQKIGKFFQKLFSKDPPASPPSDSRSRWSLSSHVASVVISCIHWNQLTQFLQPYSSSPSFASLEIETLARELNNKTWDRPHALPIILPPSLTSLEIRNLSGGSFKSRLDCDAALLEAVGKCANLTRLYLPILSDKSLSTFVNGFTPLTSLHQLRHLSLFAQLNSLQVTNACFDIIGTKLIQLEYLHLMLYTASGWSEEENIAQVRRLHNLSHLCRLITDKKLTTELVHEVWKNHPEIEEFTGSYQAEFAGIPSDPPIELSLWTRFTHLRRIIIFLRPLINGVAGSSEKVIASQLGTMLHLTDIAFHDWIPFLDEFWDELTQHLSHLTSLEFQTFELNPLTHRLTLAQPYLSHRLQKLKIVYGTSESGNTILESGDDFTQLRHFTALTDVDIEGQNLYRRGFYHQLYFRFDSGDFLPQLTRLQLYLQPNLALVYAAKRNGIGSNELEPNESSIKIRYEPAKRRNVVKFTQQTDKEQVLHRRKNLEVANSPASSSSSPPAPRLVGIELNPGPQSHDGSSTSITSSSSSSSSSSSASSSSFHSSPSFPSLLFCDGLSSIFAFLDTRSFIQAATVCRYYFLIATRTRMHVSLTLNDTSFVPSLVKIQEQRSMIEKSIIEQNEPRHPAVPLPTSKWSLPHRITRVNLPNLVPWFTLPYHLAQYTRISTLTIATIHDGPSATTKDLGLPYDTLTSLTIERNGAQLLSEKAASVLVTSLGRCIKLTHLKLMEVPLHNARPDGSLPSPPTFSFRPDAPFDYTPLHELTQLRVCILRIQLPSSLDATTQFCHALGQMKSLIHLSLDLISGGDLGQDQLRLLQLPQLTHFSSINTRLDYVSLNVMSRVMPQLEMINISRTIPINITGLALHTHLTSIHLYGRTLVGQDNHPGEENEIVDVLCSSKWTSSIIHLHLRNCVFQSSQDWSRISTSLTSLTSLELERSGGNLVPLAQGRAGANDLSVAESMTRLQQLKLVYSDINDLLLYLRKFTHITQLYVREDSSRAIEPRSVLAAFNQSDYLPQLKKLEWPPRGDINIHFDLNANINYVKFGDQIRPQTEEEKRLHRIPPLSRDDVSTTPPQSRLVGIEPNPGPSSSPSAVNIFSDGLAMIYSFVPRPDLLSLASVHRHWFHVMSRQTSTFGLLLHVHSSTDVASSPKFSPFGRLTAWLKGTLKKENAPAAAAATSEWSLRAAIREIILDSAEWFTLSQRLHQFPSATHLTIHQISFPSGVQTVRHVEQKIGTDTFVLPPSITLLDLAFGGSLEWELKRYVLDNILHAVPSLQSLKIVDSRHTNSLARPAVHSQYEYEFRFLSRLVNLTSLEYDSNVCGNVSVRLYSAIGSLPNLMRLVILKGNYSTHGNDILAIKFLPQLRIAHLPFSQLPLDQLHERIPRLEEFRTYDHRYMNLLPLAKFQHLHTLHIAWNPAPELGHNLGTLLSTLPNLTNIIFRERYWSLSPEEWEFMDLSLTNLIHLEFHTCLNFAPLDALATYAPRLASQLTRLTIHNCSAKTEKPLRQQLTIFSSLTYLNISATPMLKHTSPFDLDDPSVMPNLKNLSINGRVYRQYVTPAPRLVGIEPNPGPSSSAASPSTLFNDGLRIIYSYLDHQEWLICSVVSHHWFAIASKSAKRRLLFKRSDVTLIIKKPQKNKSKSKRSSWFCFPRNRIADEEEEEDDAMYVPPISPWSLRHHIGTILCGHLTWSKILHEFQVTPSLDSLIIARLTADPPEPQKSLQKPPQADIQLPLTLTSLSLSYMCILREEQIELQLIVDLIGRCRNLTQLSYDQFTGRTDMTNQSSFATTNYACWSSLRKMASLSLNIDTSTQFTQESLWWCIYGKMTNLTYLNIQQLPFRPPKVGVELAAPAEPALAGSSESVEVSPSPPATLPQLHTLVAPISLSTVNLRLLHSVMPNVTSLHSLHSFMPIHLESLDMFSKLRNISFDQEPIMNTQLAGLVREEHRAVALSRCTSLTRLQFHTWSWKDSLCWTRLSAKLTHLTHLDFHGIDTHDPLPHMDNLNSESLWDRVRHLTLSSCSRLSPMFFREKLEKLTSLTHFTLSGKLSLEEDSDTIVECFNTRSYCSHLESIVIRTPTLQINFDSATKRNECAIISPIRNIGPNDTKMTHSQLHRPFIKHNSIGNNSSSNAQGADVSSSFSPPAPLLVGIEPNPGPPPESVGLHPFSPAGISLSMV